MTVPFASFHMFLFIITAFQCSCLHIFTFCLFQFTTSHSWVYFIQSRSLYWYIWHLFGECTLCYTQLQHHNFLWGTGSRGQNVFGGGQGLWLGEINAPCPPTLVPPLATPNTKVCIICYKNHRHLKGNMLQGSFCHHVCRWAIVTYRFIQSWACQAILFILWLPQCVHDLNSGSAFLCSH